MTLKNVLELMMQPRLNPHIQVAIHDNPGSE